MQRDLEDQIQDEYKTQGKNYQRTTKKEDMKISAKEVLSLLKQGYTRLKRDDLGYGSIQEKYGITTVQTIQLFTHSKLKGKKTIVPVIIEVIDDVNEIETEDSKEEPREIEHPSSIGRSMMNDNLQVQSIPLPGTLRELNIGVIQQYTTQDQLAALVQEPSPAPAPISEDYVIATVTENTKTPDKESLFS